ncbi:F-box only protein 28 [Cimex lectularius]|uniref:F-box domain-containing protein n=1 Tax=Cimex lectularius TaxID=79782 RepID=A0A8I6RAU8_CIMLE|nr:F-box only protein 28 [Cimex lectularius]XP_014240417.1 F-box only protein 28 [Cimex lectularius]XP_014240419.1 F-box only protein 28 [Cimex lectularius]
MVSTRLSSNVGGNGSEGTVECGGIKTRHMSAHQPQSHEIVPAGAVKSPQEYVSSKHFLQLPPEIFHKIFSYTGYKAVSQMRLVCRQMDKICGSILNSTFQKLQNQMHHRFQNIKGKMPRRESARRNHPLACESDIIETLHMRLTLLQMSFGKHIERKHCCFFAGEILDEVYRILHYIKVTPKLARPYRVTDELFDLSTMAMEYFKEHIEPTLPEIAYFGTDFFDFSSGLQHTSNNKTWMFESPPHNSGSGKVEYESPGPSEDRVADQPVLQSQPQTNMFLRKRIRKIKQGMKKYNSQLTILKRELRSCKSKMADQQQQFHEYAARMDDYDKKNEETSRKFSTLLQELNKCKTELQYWRSKSPLSTLCVACKASTSAPTGEFQFFGLFDEPQPSTSSASDEMPISWKASPSPVVVKESNADEEEVKARQIVGAKRKSTSDETPTTHKKQKKTRCFKMRSKCS